MHHEERQLSVDDGGRKDTSTEGEKAISESSQRLMIDQAIAAPSDPKSPTDSAGEAQKKTALKKKRQPNVQARTDPSMLRPSNR